MTTRDRLACAGCGVDTFAIGEWYMVDDDVWPRDRFTADGGDYLCIGCLEQLVGRALGPADFTPCPLNIANLGDGSLRLRRRLWGLEDPPCPHDGRFAALADRIASLIVLEVVDT